MELWRDLPSSATPWRLSPPGWCPACGTALRDDRLSTAIFWAGIVIVAGLLALDWRLLPFDWASPLGTAPTVLLVLVAAGGLSILVWEPMPDATGVNRVPFRAVAGMSRTEFFRCPLCDVMSLVRYGAQHRMLVLHEPLACPACRAHIDVNPRLKVDALLMLWMMLAFAAAMLGFRHGYLSGGGDPLRTVSYLSMIPFFILLMFAFAFRTSHEPLLVGGARRTAASVCLHWATLASLVAFVVLTMFMPLAK